MFSERIQRLSGSLIREILAAAQRPEVISFAGGLPASQCLPELDLGSVPQSLAQYGTTEGEPELREAIAREANKMGIACSADQVLVLSGSQQALDLAAKLFVDPGTPVLTEGPTYLAALQVLKLFGAEIHAVPQHADGSLDAGEFGAAIDRVRPAFSYLIPSFQNPSGACYDEANRKRLAEVLDTAGVPVFEDDPYRALSYDGDAPAPLVSHLKKASFIYAGSFSKTLVPGLREGYLIASPDLYPYLVKLKQAADLHTNRIGQWYVARALNDPGYAAHIDKLRATYRAGRDVMQDALARHFSDLADWQLPRGGLFFWLTLKTPQDTRKLLARALEHNVAFMPGEPFYPNPEDGIGHLRLNFSHTAPERIEEGIARLAALVRG